MNGKQSAVSGAFLVLLATTVAAAQGTSQVDVGKEIIKASGVRAGLCVHLGATDGTLTAQLGRAGNFVVHALAVDDPGVDRARRHVQSLGLYGRVSIERSSFERLPYADSLVNLLVADDLTGLLAKGLPLTEIVRVLASNGAAIVDLGGMSEPDMRRALAADEAAAVTVLKTPSGWARITKRRPAEVDQWTHHNYDPAGNRVSKDMVVGPPQRLRWIAGVEWQMPDYSAKGMVVGGDRVFYVINECPYRKVSWPYLSARDAYSGVLLWKQPLAEFNPLTMIVSGDRLYLSVKGRLAAFDAATGQVIKTYDETARPYWAVLDNDRLLVSCGRTRALRCLDPETGKLRWQNAKRSFEPSGGLTNIAVDDREIFFAERRRGSLGCLDLDTGAEKWHRDVSGDIGGEKNGVLCSYQKGTIILGGNKGVHAFSSKDGRHLWSHSHEMLGTPSRRKAKSYVDGFFIDGLYWIHVGDVLGEGPKKYKVRKYSWQGLDPATGQLRKRFDYPEGVSPGASCYRDQATARYFMGGYTDFVQTKTGKYLRRATGVHASCGIGARPAYGLLYNSALYMPGRFLQGDMALTTAPGPDEAQPAGPRLEKGPAFGMGAGADAGDQDWPCYRHDPLRTGRTALDVPAQLTQLWERQVRQPARASAEAGRLSAPTVAGDSVFVASVDEHRVTALDAATGEIRWSYTAGGRTRIPPTFYKGVCLFGSADGWVYCLRASDGTLVWRFRVARTARRIVARGRVESPWPVDGGVLVVDGLACFAAGRHGDVDGGIDLYAVEPLTGKVAWHERVRRSLTLSLLASDGRSLSIWDHRSRFALKPGGKRPATPQVPSSAYDANLLDPTRVIGRTDERLDAWAVAPVRMKAIARAGDTVFVAGRPDAKSAGPPEIRWVKSRRSVGAAGRAPERHPLASPGAQQQSSRLWAFSAATGKMASELELAAPPVFDGMAAAGNRLYVSTQDGKIRCFGKR